jgi:hypothetical protein
MKKLYFPLLIGVILLFNVSWQANVFGSELFATTSSNVAQANEVGSPPGTDAQLGSPLTFLATNTGLSRSFQVETLTSGAGFTFNDQNSGPLLSDALSVGDVDDVGLENDDWRLTLFGGSTMTGFGVLLKNNKYESGESIKMYSGGVLKATLTLGDLADGSDSDDFLGVTTDFAFDRVDFDEDGVLSGDDIAIADFRFATVVPEPVSSTLFIVGAATLGLRKWRKKRTS